MRIIFSLLGSAVSIYSLLCIIRIIITWIPGASYSKFAYFLSRVCDPYINFFRRFRFLNFSGLDFSPALALCVLGAAASIFTSFSRLYNPSAAFIVTLMLSAVFSLISSIIFFFIVILVIRLIFIFVKGEGYYSPSVLFSFFDNFVSKIVFSLTRLVSFGKQIRFRNAIIISIVMLIVLDILLSLGFGFIESLLI